MMFSIQSRRFLVLLTTFTTAAFGASDGRAPKGWRPQRPNRAGSWGTGSSGSNGSSRTYSPTPSSTTSTTTSTGGFSSTSGYSGSSTSSSRGFPDSLPVSEIFFSHGDTNLMNSEYREGRVPIVHRLKKGKGLKTLRDGSQVPNMIKQYKESQFTPTVYDTAMALLFGAHKVQGKVKGARKHDGIIQRLIERSVNFRAVTRAQLSKALADTQTAISRNAGWSCTPEIVVASEGQIEELHDLPKSEWDQLCKDHFDDDVNKGRNGMLVQGDYRTGNVPVYFSQNNRSLYALKMVKSLFECEMNAPVKYRHANLLSDQHIFDRSQVGIEGAGAVRMGLRFYSDGVAGHGTMYNPRRKTEHPSRAQVEQVFPGSMKGKDLYVGYFNKTNFLNCVKARMAETGLDTTWFDAISDMELVFGKRFGSAGAWRRRMLLEAEF